MNNRHTASLTSAQMDPLLAPRPSEELFHVKDDPYQIWNLVEDPGHKEKPDQLSKVLDKWQKRTGDTVPPLDKPTPACDDRTGFKR